MRKLLVLMLSCLMLAGQAWSQSRTITGRITDNEGKPLEGVTVSARGTDLRTLTDADGKFTFTVGSTVKALIFSFVGYAAQTVNLTEGNAITLSLKPETSDLSEVVITGYGRAKKSEYVGAAAKIDKKAIELVPIGSFEQILQGRAPGLRVSSGSGQPGAAADVQIRGPKSISGGSTPLYVIDGVPVEAGVFQSYNPNDFESVDVIKDASAAALYGSRGASGVIVVTTKRGQSGKTSLTYRGQAGITQPGTQRFEMMNSPELLQFQEDLGKFIGNTTLPGWAYSPENPAYQASTPAQQARYDFLLDSLSGINTDWADIYQREGNFNSHDLSLQGGTGRTTYYTSLGLYDEQGIGLRSDMKRYTLRANIDHNTDKMTFGLRLNGGYTKRNFIESENGVALANPFAAAYLALPYHDLFRADGSIATGSGRVGPNTYERTMNSKRYNDQIKSTATVFGTYNITKNVYVGGNLGVDFRETVTTFWLDPNSFAASTSGFPTNTGTYSEALNRYYQLNSRGYVGYKNTFKERHNVEATLNAEYIERKTRTFSMQGYGINPKLPNTPAAITPGTVDNRLIAAVGGSKSERAYVSFFGNVKYNFDQKYFLDFTARRDGVSILPEENRFENFFSIGGVWNVLKENFANDWRMFSTLRFRASYGSSANAENFPFGDFGYLPLYGAGSYAGFPTLVPTTPGNPQGEWEYADKFNMGFEFGMLKNRLTGEVNLYNEITRNLFIDQQIPSENGGAFTTASVNAGEMRNRGVEVQLNYEIIRSKDITWSVGGNFSYNDNEITDLGQEKEYPSGTAIIRVGLPLGSHYIVKWGGVDAATGAPLYYDRSNKLTTRFNEADMAVAEFGTFYAPYNGGFNTDFNWKGFQISGFFNFQAEFSRFNNQDFFQLNHAFAQQGFNLRTEMANMWKKPGDVTDIQSPLFQRQFTSKDIQDASYLRFRNLMVGYTIPAKVLSRQNVVKSFRIYSQVQNLYTWTNWTGFDPEDDDNIAQYEYPSPRTFTFGIDVTF